ncbi:hypothetical protein EIP86_008110 [Pleurotus ostreatoroseus]|nr:hypothetical protein EIP86_008110 [Pleurotus ostreatoroseus]
MSSKGTVTASTPYGKQPWYTIYLAYQLTTTILLRLPLWVLYYAVPSNRPKPTWSLKRAIMLRIVKLLICMGYMVGPLGHTPSYLAIEDGPNVRAVWIAPTPQLVIGKLKEWAVAAGVESVRIPGYWHHKAGDDRAPGTSARPGEKVLLALHGGAYIQHSAHPADHIANITTGILGATPSLSRALSVEYRLTQLPPLMPTNPFPAALLDAIAGYNYLVDELGFDPADIVVHGDSAGANLALALVRYLVEYRASPGANLPAPPGALLLCSPWADLSIFGHDVEGSMRTNIPSDYVNVTTGHIEHIVTTYTGALGPFAAGTNRYISPASSSPLVNDVPFTHFPRTFILNGGSEALRDQVQVLKKTMATEMGTNVMHLEMPDAIHDFLVFLWHEPERSEALTAIAAWLQSD